MGPGGTTPNDARAPARGAFGAKRAVPAAAAGRSREGRQLRSPRWLQTPGPVEGGEGRSSGGRRAGRRAHDQGAPLGSEQSPEDRQPHGRGPRRGCARGGRRPVGLGDREVAGAKASLGRATPGSGPSSGERSGLAGRSRPSLAHARHLALGLRPGGTAPPGGRRPAPPAHHARDGGLSRHLSQCRSPDARGAAPRPQKRSCALRATRRLSPGPRGRRDRLADGRDRARAP